MVPALRLFIVCATLKQIKIEVNIKVVVVPLGACIRDVVMPFDCAV